MKHQTADKTLGNFAANLASQDEVLTQEHQQCLDDLLLTDPRFDIKYIVESKGVLVKASYRRFLDSNLFQKWQKNDEDRLLLIKGYPGTGKTMLMCDIIGELASSSHLLSFFLCQESNPLQNSATAVLRGLIYVFLSQRRTLIRHLLEPYNRAGRALFEGKDAFSKLSQSFETMLHDPLARGSYIVIDALNECITGRDQLLNLIKRFSGSHVKWILSNRLMPDISSLELSAYPLEIQGTANISDYLYQHVSRLAKLYGIDEGSEIDRLCKALESRANGVFLWASLVIQLLEAPQYWRPLRATEFVESISPDLDSAYDKLMESVRSRQIKAKDASLYLDALARVAVAHRPLTLFELGALLELSDGMYHANASQRAIESCTPLLTIQNDSTYLVSQTFKSYIASPRGSYPLGFSLENLHLSMVLMSIKAMGRILKRDIYDMKSSSAEVPQRRPDPDPLAPIRYSCLYWVTHLTHGPSDRRYFADNSIIHRFLQSHFLHWVEALILMRSLSTGIRALSRLSLLIPVRTSQIESMLLRRS
ncbi:Vegetative incompatibility protein HET-E-1 [Colletotrichum tropicale]|nr:Vegetative incompatibility protein HET-E-1 [Colletotrichum tropicale]